MHVGLAELHLERNELDAAAEHVRASLELGERLALPQHAYRWRVVEARLRAAGGDHAGALELLSEAEQRYDTDYSPKARPVTATTARARLASGDLGGAERWAADVRSRPPTTNAHYLREYEHLTLARVLLATGRTVRRRPAAPAPARRRRGRRPRGQRHRSAAAPRRRPRSRRRHAEGAPALEDALIRAEVERFVRIFLDAGAPMTGLLEAAVRHGRAADTGLRPPRRGRGTGARQAQQGLVDELSTRELDVLRLLRSELTGPRSPLSWSFRSTPSAPTPRTSSRSSA